MPSQCSIARVEYFLSLATGGFIPQKCLKNKNRNGGFDILTSGGGSGGGGGRKIS